MCRKVTCCKGYQRDDDCGSGRVAWKIVMMMMSRASNGQPRRGARALTAVRMALTMLLMAGMVVRGQTNGGSAGSYVRPLDGDCVAYGGGGEMPPQGTLFPPEYMIQGAVGGGGEDQEGVGSHTAAEFSVTYYPRYKVVENKVSGEIFVLYQCGTQAPVEGEEGIPSGAKMFEIPLTSVSIPETVPYAFVELLGVDDRVYDAPLYVTAACGQKIAECGRQAVDLFSNDVDNVTLQQTVFEPNVDGVLLTTREEYDGAFSFNPVKDDGGVLSRAEWVKYLGAFFNKDRYASDIFNAIKESYEETKNAVDRQGESRPVVAWVTHFVFGDEERYEVSVAPYKTEYVRDAGAENVDIDEIKKAYPGVTDSAYSNDIVQFAWGQDGEGFATKKDAQEAFWNFLSSVDVIIDETYTFDPLSYTFEEFMSEYGLDGAAEGVLSGLPWLEPKLVYREDGLISKSNGVDWFEGAIARPDLVLMDVARIVGSAQQGERTKVGEFTWLRNIAETPVRVTADDCKRLDSCNDTPTTICPFVKGCEDGSTAVLMDSAVDSGECAYQVCIQSDQGSADNSGDSLSDGNSAEDTAQMAAPAVILLTLLIVFVEALINFC